MNIKQPNSLSVRPVLNGFVVQFGCQEIVFKTPAELGEAITAYYKDPGAATRDYLRKPVNQTLTPEFVDSLLDPRQGEPECAPRHGILRTCGEVATNCAEARG